MGLAALLVGGTLVGPGVAAASVGEPEGQVCATLTPSGGPVEVARVVISGYLQNGRHETDSFGLRATGSGTYAGCSHALIWGQPDVWTGRVHLTLIVNAHQLGTADPDAGAGRRVSASWSVEVPPADPPGEPTPWIPCPPSC